MRFCIYVLVKGVTTRVDYNKILGEIFFIMVDEIADITFDDSMQIIFTALFEAILVVFQPIEANPDIIDKITYEFQSLSDSHKLLQGSGIFDFGEFQIHV